MSAADVEPAASRKRVVEGAPAVGHCNLVTASQKEVSDGLKSACAIFTTTAHAQDHQTADEKGRVCDISRMRAGTNYNGLSLFVGLAVP